MDLNSDNVAAPITIGQQIPTKIGANYVVSFSLNQNPCGPSMTKTGTVSAGTAGSKTFTISDTNTKVISLDFQANSESTLIQIGSTTPNSGIHDF